MSPVYCEEGKRLFAWTNIVFYLTGDESKDSAIKFAFHQGYTKLAHQLAQK